MFDEAHFKKWVCENPSELGLEVARFVSDLVGGWHHIDADLEGKVDWTNDHHIVVPWPKHYGMHTVDSDRLTRLVVMSHDRMLRVEINPRHYRWLELVFHKRKNRDGKFWETMPDILDHITRIRNTPT